jgi:hypothetical protein
MSEHSWYTFEVGTCVKYIGLMSTLSADEFQAMRSVDFHGIITKIGDEPFYPYVVLFGEGTRVLLSASEMERL